MGKKQKTTQKKGYEDVKTTILLPGDLWEQAKVLAVKQRKDFRVIVIEALREYLKKRGGKQ